jgi:hypothetical protein
VTALRSEVGPESSDDRNHRTHRLLHGRGGDLRRAAPTTNAWEDQLGALGLVLNYITLWTASTFDAALTQLVSGGYPSATRTMRRGGIVAATSRQTRPAVDDRRDRRPQVSI